jgi:hypothetical protein
MGDDHIIAGGRGGVDLVLRKPDAFQGDPARVLGVKYFSKDARDSVHAVNFDCLATGDFKVAIETVREMGTSSVGAIGVHPKITEMTGAEEKVRYERWIRA